jgi:hypothetical protein
MDFYLLKKISNLIKGNKEVREANQQNILISSNNVERNARNNNEVRDIHRLDEEI